MTGDLFVINPPREPSWISTASKAASTWLWEHGDIILLFLGETLLAAVIVAVFVWRERRKAQRADAETMRRIGAMEFNHRREED
jgi:heme/copper-type cytochrome/quinol oxidase subunit 2